MKTIWNDTLYMAKHQPPYMNTRIYYGEKEDTIFFFYGITPSGRVSKFWAAYHTIPELSTEQKLRNLDYYIQTRRPGLPRGYKWSEPYLYAGEL